MEIINNFKAFFIGIGIVISSFFGVYFLGKKYGRKEMENQQDKEALDAIRKSVKIRQSNSNLTRNELIDKLRPWIKKD